MSSLDISVPHDLGQEEAISRVQAFIAQARKQFGDKSNDVKETWNENVCTFDISANGVALSGTLTVLPDKVTLTSKLPMAAVFFKGKLESALTDGLAMILKR